MAFRIFIRRTAAVFITTGLAFGAAQSSALAQTQASDEGLMAFNNACRTCHTTKEGDNRLGPHLYGIVGRKAGAVQGYGYSSAMKDAGFEWDETRLDAFIANPEAVVPGNSMKPFSGIQNAEERKKIISYLASTGG